VVSARNVHLEKSVAECIEQTRDTAPKTKRPIFK